MCLAQGPQRSDAGEARTRGPSVSSQAPNIVKSLKNDEVSKHIPVLDIAKNKSALISGIAEIRP